MQATTQQTRSAMHPGRTFGARVVRDVAEAPLVLVGIGLFIVGTIVAFLEEARSHVHHIA